MKAGASLTAAVSLRREAATAAQPVSPRSQASLSRLRPSLPSRPRRLHPCAPSLARPDPQPCHGPAAGTAPGSPRQRWRTPMLPPGLGRQAPAAGRQAPAAGLAAGMHLLKHHEDVEMDRTGKRGSGSRLGPGRAPWRSRPGSRAPAGLPSHVPRKPDINTATLAPFSAQPTRPRQTLQVFNKKVQKMYTETKPPSQPLQRRRGSHRLKHT